MSQPDERQQWALRILEVLNTTIGILALDKQTISHLPPPDPFANVLIDEVSSELRNASNGLQLVQEHIRKYAVEGKV